ncbi:hypothetical protein JQ581_19145 [Bradyrhizobium liaoningense]|uniref:hypothetical protein n=1 Tax=Bradyrhizobium liaoningense TaxID=43992 RepID=UPI001BAA575E|nr:hypothetical protein [Bradyrhizobium liaoningense]MBR0739052.1 hypothetical protein [Bradyrhizobium liaoningense]
MLSLVIGLLAVVLFVSISAPMQALARRLLPSTSPVAFLAAAAVIAHLTTSLLAASLLPSFQYWIATSVFCFGGMVYVQVFGAVLKSVSLGILLDLTRRPGRRIDLDEIVLQRLPQIFAERCDILIATGMVAREQDEFVPTAAGRKLAARVARLRRLFGIGDSSLYNFDTADSWNSRAVDRTEN